MTRKSTLGQMTSGPVGSPSGGPSGGVSDAGPANQGGFNSLVPGMFPVGVPVGGGQCPSGYLPAPSATIPGGYTCVRAPGAYTVPLTLAGRR